MPILNWAAGSVVALSIVAFAFWLFKVDISRPGLFSEALYSIGWALFVVLVFFLSIFDVASKVGIFAEWTSLRIDRSEEFIEIVQTRIYGRRKIRYYFYQVDRFRSHKKKTLGFEQYYLALKLANRRSTLYAVPLGKDKNSTVKLIKELNRFIRTKRK